MFELYFRRRKSKTHRQIQRWSRSAINLKTSQFHVTPLSSGTNQSAAPLAWSHEPLPVFHAPLPQCVSIVTLAEVQTAGRALWRALHTHHMKDFHQATAASRRHTNGILLLKGGHASTERRAVSTYQGGGVPANIFLFFFLCFYSFIFAVVQGNPEQAWIMSDMFFWHGELLFCPFVFSVLFFFQFDEERYNEIIDSRADCVSAPCENAAVLSPVAVKRDDHCESQWQRTALNHLNSSRSLDAFRKYENKKKMNPVAAPSGSCDRATVWDKKKTVTF